VSSDSDRKKDKEVKVATAKTPWVPAVNNHGKPGPVGGLSRLRTHGMRSSSLVRG
jgi:hypothetical protein